MPLVLLSIPWMWKQFRTSEVLALEEANQTLAAVAKELAGAPA